MAQNLALPKYLSDNRLLNADFRKWSNGYSSAPDNWVLYNSTCSRSGLDACALVGTVPGGSIYQDIILPKDDGYSHYAGKRVRFDVKMAGDGSVSSTTISIEDGVTSVTKTVSLSTTAQYYSLEAVISSSPTKVRVGVYSSLSNTIYIHQASFREISTSPFPVLSPQEQDTTLALPVSGTAANSASEAIEFYTDVGGNVKKFQISSESDGTNSYAVIKDNNGVEIAKFSDQNKAIFSSLQVTSGAGNGYVLQSDASGNASWASIASYQEAYKHYTTSRTLVATINPTNTSWQQLSFSSFTGTGYKLVLFSWVPNMDISLNFSPFGDILIGHWINATYFGGGTSAASVQNGHEAFMFIPTNSNASVYYRLFDSLSPTVSVYIWAHINLS